MGLLIRRTFQVDSGVHGHPSPNNLKGEPRALLEAFRELQCDERLMPEVTVDRTETYQRQGAERSIRMITCGSDAQS